MKKPLMALGLLLLGAAAGAVGYRHATATRPLPQGALRLHGNIDVRDVSLAFFGQEHVDRVLVEEGARVEPDQLLATLETDRLDEEVAGLQARIAAQQAAVERLENGSRPQEIERARAEVDAALARAANTEREITRLETTVVTGATSAQELDDVRARLEVERAQTRARNEELALALEGPRREDVDQARATLDALRADLRLAERRLADSELRAPSPGVIQSRLLEPGDLASPERAVFTLALTSPKWARVWVPEPELARVAPGMRATVFADALGGKDYEGWVGFVSPVAEFTPRAVETEELRTKLVYEVRVFLEDPADELSLGMPVTVDVDSAGGTGHAPAEAGGGR